MSDYYEWDCDARQNLLNDGRELITGRELAEQHRSKHSSGEYSETELHEAIMFVLCKNSVDFESEKELDHPIRRGDVKRTRRCDIYIPETDTAIELKREASLRGLGQVAYYAHMHREAVLLVSEHDPAIARVARSLPAVHYGQVLPGILEDPPKLAVSTDSRCHFFFEANHGCLGGDRWFVKKPEPETGSAARSADRELSEFEQTGGVAADE